MLAIISLYTFKHIRSEALLPGYSYPKPETSIIRLKSIKRIIVSTTICSLLSMSV